MAKKARKSTLNQRYIYSKTSTLQEHVRVLRLDRALKPMWTDGPILPEPFPNPLTSDFDEDKYNDGDDIGNVSDVYPDSLGVEDYDD